MFIANRKWGVLLAAALAGIAGPAAAASKESTYEACVKEVQKEFGESPVEFEKFRRNDTRHMAFGKITLSDGSVREIRCRIRNGQLLDMQFRGGNTPGSMWTDTRPPAAIYVEPKEEAAAGAETAAAGSGEAPKPADTAAAAAKPGDGAEPKPGEGADAKPGTGGEAAAGEAAAKDGAAAGSGETATAEAPQEAKPSRFKKVPTQ